MKISVLIASWNTRDFLRMCLQAIFETALAEDETLQVEVIIVDNASSDGSAAMVRLEFPQANLIESGENLGFGRATNHASRLATGEAWLLLNTDALLHPGALQGMAAYLESHASVGAVGPRILNPDGSLQISCSPSPTLWREIWRLFHLDALAAYSRYSRNLLDDHLKPGAWYNVPLPVDVLLGACILLRREVAEKVGLFDEQFFMYSEEVDLCLRIHQAGWQIIWLPEETVTHFGGQSTRQAADKMFIELYRNKIYYFRKHGGRVRVGLYKIILYSAALSRWIPGTLLANTQTGQARKWKQVARQYRLLLNELARM